MPLLNTYGKYALDDTFLKQKFVDIIKEYDINTIVETGVHEGRSTLEFSHLVENVIGIDILEESISIAKNRIDNSNRTNVKLYVGNSPQVLSSIVDSIDAEHTIFFLDAHWESYWPINDEIKMLPKNKGIIIVHDFLVPNHPELGFDAYNNQPFTYEFIKESLTNWSNSHRVEYNTQANGSNRGVGFIYNK
jgi:predicted O-methyltransferase YrrM